MLVLLNVVVKILPLQMALQTEATAIVQRPVMLQCKIRENERERERAQTHYLSEERERELKLKNFILQGLEREQLSVKSDASLWREAHEYSLFHFLKCKEPVGLMHTKVFFYI